MITDVEMPRRSINGFELVRRVRSDREDIRIAIASGQAAPKVGDLPEGALFLGKPVRPETLVRLLKTLLTSEPT
jgi:CheY-like chemotaxis protein